MTKGYDPNLVKIAWMHYYFYWFTRDNREVLVDNRKIVCEQLIKEKIKELGCEIRDLSIYNDCVHLGVKSIPIFSPHDIITKIKGHTSNNLRKKFPNLLKMPSLWTRSYFVSSFGPEIPNDEMQEYAEWIAGRGKKKQ
jgi:putative transposase